MDVNVTAILAGVGAAAAFHLVARALRWGLHKEAKTRYHIRRDVYDEFRADPFWRKEDGLFSSNGKAALQRLVTDVTAKIVVSATVVWRQDDERYEYAFKVGQEEAFLDVLRPLQAAVDANELIVVDARWTSRQ